LTKKNIKCRVDKYILPEEFMGKYFKKLALSFLFLILIFSACTMTKSYIKSSSPDDAFKKYDSNDLSVESLFLDEQALKNRHGKIANPFISPDLLFTPQYMIVFELKITNKDSAPIVLDSREVNFYFGEKTYRPMSTVKMQDKIKENAEPGTLLKEERIAKETMLPLIINVPAYGTVKGYYVFMGNLKGKDVAAELVLPFKDINKTDSATVNFKYTFTLIK
jgi:hypothetical protein